MNRYQLAQIVSFAVDDLKSHETNLLSNVADIRKVPEGGEAAFRIRLGNVKAYTQAKGATTVRSTIGSKQIVLDTQEISVRPSINLMDLKAGYLKMSDLVREAKEQLVGQEYALAQRTLNTGMTQWATPFYGAGTGIVKTVLDPMINFWKRTGRVVLLGDIEALGKLTEMTGFAANTTTTQFSDDLIREHNQNGYLGTYMGAQVVALTNPYLNETTTVPAFDTDKIYILPAAASADMRPLKMVYQGGVMQDEAKFIDDGSYDICLREWVGAGMVHGGRPYMSCYKVQ